MTNMNRFLGLKHIFIFQQSSTIKQKAQKHKRYVVVNCAAQPVAYAGIINGRGFKTEIRYNDVILIPL